MALAEVQRALARLVTDATLRDAFLGDPQRGARTLGLGEADADLLSTVAPAELRRYSAALAAKRALDARKRTPLVAAALGGRFDALTEDAAKRSGDLVDQTDRLAKLAVALARAGEIEPQLGDLARYEAACFAAGQRRSIMRVRLFRYPIANLVAALQTGVPSAEILPRRSFAIWVRFRGGRLWRRAWTSPLSQRERGRG